MVEKVISKDQECNHILIVGGGDLLCANYILNHFPKVKDITVCEMDGRVIVIPFFFIVNFLNTLFIYEKFRNVLKNTSNTGKL